MSELFEALDRSRRSQQRTWAQEAARGYATPDTDGQLRDIWEARELLSAAASVLASLRADRAYDPILAEAEQLLVSVHHGVYRVECSRHRELGSVAPGERRARERRLAGSSVRAVPPVAPIVPARPARGPTGRR